MTSSATPPTGQPDQTAPAPGPDNEPTTTVRIRPDVAALINRRIGIPRYPTDRRGAESLNVAISTAIICAELRRRAR